MQTKQVKKVGNYRKYICEIYKIQTLYLAQSQLVFKIYYQTQLKILSTCFSWLTATLKIPSFFKLLFFNLRASFRRFSIILHNRFVKSLNKITFIRYLDNNIFVFTQIFSSKKLFFRKILRYIMIIVSIRREGCFFCHCFQKCQIFNRQNS